MPHKWKKSDIDGSWLCENCCRSIERQNSIPSPKLMFWVRSQGRLKGISCEDVQVADIHEV